MKWLLFLLLILIPLGVIVAAEFYGQTGPLAVVKENVNDHFHVYRTVSGGEERVITDALDVDADLKAELRENFPEDMADFITRFEAELSEMELKNGTSAEVIEARSLLQEAKTGLAKGGEAAVVEAERLVEAAVEVYLSLQVQAS